MSAAQFTLDIIHEVNNDAQISALIGTKFYIGSAPQDVAIPYVVGTVITVMDELCHDGPIEIYQHRIQMDILAQDQRRSLQIWDALEGFFNGLNGAIGSGNTTKIFWCRIDGEYDHGEQENGDFRRSVDFLLQWESNI